MQLVRNKVLNFIKKHDLFAPGDKVVVAFSGGADSRALLDILASLPGFPLKLILAHLNHCLRGEESDADEVFVSIIAEKYGFPLETARIDVAAAAAEGGLSLEEAGRNARRTFLTGVVAKYSASVIALGHHRDDQAETVLMRLLRGAAGSGLTGMHPSLNRSVFVRPLLCLTRAEIEGYLQKGSFQWREDRSNADTKFIRNRIRHELLPLLRSYNPSIVETLNLTAETLAADEELLQSVTERVLPQMVSTHSGEVRLNLEMLRREPAALRKRLYRRALALLSGDLRRISSTHLADMDQLATGRKGGGKLSLPFGVVVKREYSSMFFTLDAENSSSNSSELSVCTCGEYRFGDKLRLTVAVIDSPPVEWQGVGTDIIYVDAERFPFPWVVRSFRNGDSFTPFGMNGRKKLKDLFIDNKVPFESRRKIPILLSRGEILWVGGVQMSEKARITGPSRTLLRLQLFCEAPSERH